VAAAADNMQDNGGIIIDPAVASVAAITQHDTAAAPAESGPVAAAADMLVLKLREDSWVEIRRAGDSTPVARRLLKAGTTETFKISGPVSLTIGNAAGVDATLRGTPLPLQADAKNNVAHLNLK
jgi:cytoskeleton protein RodZ